MSFVSIFWYNLNGFLNVENVRQFFPCQKGPDDPQEVVDGKCRITTVAGFGDGNYQEVAKETDKTTKDGIKSLLGDCMTWRRCLVLRQRSISFHKVTTRGVHTFVVSNKEILPPPLEIYFGGEVITKVFTQ